MDDLRGRLGADLTETVERVGSASRARVRL